MRTLVVIHARWGSSRFPGKVGASLAGMSILEHVVRRARHRGYATIISSPVSSAQHFGWSAEWRMAVPDNHGRTSFVPIHYPQADENDVLGRTVETVNFALQAGRFLGVESTFGQVVRLTADCPFVPISGIEAVASLVAGGEADYAETRSDPSTRPNGIDAQAFSIELLRRAHENATDPESREHMTPALLRYAERPVTISQLEGRPLDAFSPWRITLDTPSDLARYEKIAEMIALDPTAGRPTFGELAALAAQRPDLFLGDE